MKQLKFIFIGLFSFIFYVKLLAVDIGSDTVVNRFNTQQTVNDGDRIAGFAAIQGGVFFSNPFVNGIFDSFFPASGNINLNQGILTLNRDLILRNVSYFEHFGSVVGNNHVLELASSITCIPSPASGGGSGGNGASECGITEIVSEAQNDNVFSVSWSVNDDFVAVGLVTNGSTELLVYSFDGELLTLQDSVEYGEDVNVVSWHPTEYRLAAGTTSSTGDELFIYDFDTVGGTLTLTDSDNIGGDVTALVWRPEGNYLAVGTTVNNREVSVYPVSGAGILGTRVNINLGGNADVERGSIDWSISGDYIAVGRIQSGSPDLYVLVFDTAGPSLISNVNLDLAGDVNGVSWSPTFSSILAVGVGGGTERLIVYNHDGVAGTLTQLTFVAETTSPIQGVDWSEDGNCIYIVKEVQPTDQEFKVYSYDNDNQTLAFVEGFDFTADIFTVKSSNDGSFVMIGGADDTVTIYEKTSVLIASRPNILFNLEIKLNSDICLEQGNYTFSGNSIINGQGHCLSIGTTATLLITTDSGLLLKNLKIVDIDGNNLSFFDNSSTVSYENVELILEGDYTMTVGSFHVLKDLKVSGNGHKFIYQSSLLSTILSDAHLILDRGVTFSYDPTSASPNLLEFADATSKIILRGATLHASTAGLNLTKGTMEIDAKSFISAAGTIESQAISFGDGLNSANNFCVRWLPASVLEAMPGYIRLQNV